MTAAIADLAMKTIPISPSFIRDLRRGRAGHLAPARGPTYALDLTAWNGLIGDAPLRSQLAGE